MIHTLYFVRHGEKEETNTTEFLDNYPDYTLTSHGIQQAAFAAEALSKIDFNAIYSSDLKRAKQTASIIRAQQTHCANQEIIIDKRLREIDMGDYLKLHNDQFKLNYPGFNKELLYKDITKPFPGGESQNMFLNRIIDFLSATYTENTSGSYCIVCHAGVIRALFLHVLDLPLTIQTAFYPNHCAISSLIFNDFVKEYQIRSLNELQHLPIEYQN